jgi:hypothetical protein
MVFVLGSIALDQHTRGDHRSRQKFIKATPHTEYADVVKAAKKDAYHV